jgi:release factor glutamine methyltransferase
VPEARRRALAGIDQTAGALVQDLAGRLRGIADATREAREIMAALLDVPRHWPLLHENRWLEPGVWRQARAAAAKRAAGAPLAYAVGRASFRQLTLHVDERVLIPRPETELLVDLVLSRMRGQAAGTAVDVGTGSGAIAIALATEGCFERVIATDVSRDAIDVARANAQRIGASVEFACGDLLGGCAVRGAGCEEDAAPRTPPHAPFAAIVSNPPYITFAEASTLPASVRDWEPAVALYSARDGLAVTARLVRQAAARLAPRGLLALEVDARRASLVAELVARDQRYGHVEVHLDLAGRERFVLATRRNEERG